MLTTRTSIRARARRAFNRGYMAGTRILRDAARVTPEARGWAAYAQSRREGASESGAARSAIAIERAARGKEVSVSA